ncbi:MAG: lipopolysaccharide core heptose(II) kinase RfaY [Candidatus Cyclobacteriaceae bacterium M2_1C_046]
MQIYKYNGWRILSFIPDQEAKKIFNLVQEDSYATVSILKQYDRSKVLRFSLEDNDYVLKIPLEKNNNPWIRFTTLYRKGESFKCLYSMHKLKELQLPTAQPIMTAEKRSFGMVVDSWLVYKYVPGEHCLNKKDHYPEVIDTLQSLHGKSFLHGDPQIRNFILGEDRLIHMIDAKLKRSYFSFFSKNYEWAYLAKSAPGIENYFSFKNNFWFKAAKKADWIFRKFVRKRRKIIKAIKTPFQAYIKV